MTNASKLGQILSAKRVIAQSFVISVAIFLGHIFLAFVFYPSSKAESIKATFLIGYPWPAFLNLYGERIFGDSMIIVSVAACMAALQFGIYATAYMIGRVYNAGHFALWLGLSIVHFIGVVMSMRHGQGT